uniref:Uncharacterized protein n=1 Tax=Arundo donax TaxID=35708 RepID=A0A0A9FW19_ARUDO
MQGHQHRSNRELDEQLAARIREELDLARRVSGEHTLDGGC